MSKASRKWLVEIESWMGWEISKSFVERLDTQLKAEFEQLTGKVFDGKRFHFHLKPGDQLTYFENIEIPYGAINGTLMFIGTSVSTRFAWVDLSSKKLYKINDDLSESDVEFHWINFPADDWNVKQIKETILYDWRETYSLQANFPIISISKSIGTDISFKLKMENSLDISRVEEVLASVQRDWNKKSMEQQNSDPDYQGIVHSVRFSHANDEGVAVFPIDTGSAKEIVVIKMLNELIDSRIPIVEIEIETG